MNVVVIDGQGGGIGRALIERILSKLPDVEPRAVGTNAIATSAMLKAGAKQGATGENAVRVCANEADVILGPIGIIVADSMMGEITSTIAQTIGASRARKILIPSAKCSAYVAGTAGQGVQVLIEDAIQRLDSILHGQT